MRTWDARSGRVRLPSESCAARIAWSLVAVPILLMWFYGVLAAGCTQFLVQYSAVEVLREIAGCRSEMFWPGEFGYLSANNKWGFVQVSPVAATLCWLLCLVPFPSKPVRVVVVVAALLVPGCMLLIQPASILLGPVLGVWILVFGGSGEDFQDGHIVWGAAALWWWLMVPLAWLTIGRRDSTHGRCAGCGYDMAGLSGERCPECGAAVSPTTVATLSPCLPIPCVR